MSLQAFLFIFRGETSNMSAWFNQVVTLLIPKNLHYNDTSETVDFLCRALPTRDHSSFLVLSHVLTPLYQLHIKKGIYSATEINQAVDFSRQVFIAFRDIPVNNSDYQQNPQGYLTALKGINDIHLELLRCQQGMLSETVKGIQERSYSTSNLETAESVPKKEHITRAASAPSLPLEESTRAWDKMLLASASSSKKPAKDSSPAGIQDRDIIIRSGPYRGMKYHVLAVLANGIRCVSSNGALITLSYSTEVEIARQ